GLLVASPAWLWLAAISFATALVASGCAWRSALGRCGGELGRADASARYGVGSLVNAVAPAKLGSAVRFALYSRALPGDGKLWTTGGVAASIGAARSIWLAVLLAFAAGSGVLPAWPLAVVAAVLAIVVAVAYVSRDSRPSARVAHVLDAFRALGRCPRAAAQLIGWVGLAAAGRVGAATAIAAAFGIEQPLLAALLVVPALDLAGILPLTPGNIGIASAAVGFALHAHGATSGVAMSAGIAFAAVETVTSLAFGAGSVLYLAAGAPGARRWSLAAAGATACLGLGAAFGATVLFPLV
ncbi:MAG: flippase-like domain-containing protein, partial [Actinobacteria bacterium]|nr:flippase-like domain-containing protein [Actinomycetota bacterium]